ncbi:hypothetical protein DL89DRAFT_267289 [Linderina pennispora]|uniref:Uncharacterized protein n=1 Tax=Linderina pennispora TaxID=61395 RepID=A0A1Y1W963_9FUNG|nr:uncharacterized protein DL89DRAFT_267289 [Linderina pennispora]ORX70061.1 hypothetical protein DL89DRAFT_267289 [Linderina pennispora]
MTIGPSHPLSGSKRKRTNTNIQGAGKKTSQPPATPETKKQNTRTSSKSMYLKQKYFTCISDHKHLILMISIK